MLNQILSINNGGAYGGGKAGGAFDPVTFAMKPQVVIRALCWVSRTPGTFAPLKCAARGNGWDFSDLESTHAPRATRTS